MTFEPCRAAREEREKRRGSTATPSPEKDTPIQSETCQTSPTNSEGKEERKEERIVPQLRIGADGNIIIDEARYVDVLAAAYTYIVYVVCIQHVRISVSIYTSLLCLVMYKGHGGVTACLAMLCCVQLICHGNRGFI